MTGAGNFERESLKADPIAQINGKTFNMITGPHLRHLKPGRQSSVSSLQLVDLST